MSQVLTVEDRAAILQREIDRYVKRGWRVVSQTQTTAQLIHPKKFSWLWFIVFLGIFYLIYYAIIKKDGSAYLTVDESGKVKKR